MKNIVAGMLLVVPALLSGQTILVPYTPPPPGYVPPSGGARIGLGLGPGWPANGDISQSPATESVFFNPAVPEYVVAVRAPDGRVVRLLHAPIHNSVSPRVSSSVSRDALGMFHYTYSVSNGATAGSAIERWAVGTEEMSGTVELKHARWVSGPAPAMSGVVRDRHRAFGWSGGDSPIEAGKTAAGFEIVSSLAPGYIMAAFYGKPSIAELTPEEWVSLPSEVAAQLHARLGTGWDSQTLYIVGPRFAPGVPRDMVLDNFFNVINILKGSGGLSKDAQTAAELQSRLKTMLSGEPGVEPQLDTLVKRGRVLEPKEFEIVSTLKMTMDWLSRQ